MFFGKILTQHSSLSAWESLFILSSRAVSVSHSSGSTISWVSERNPTAPRMPLMISIQNSFDTISRYVRLMKDVHIVKKNVQICTCMCVSFNILTRERSGDFWKKVKANNVWGITGQVLSRAHWSFYRSDTVSLGTLSLIVVRIPTTVHRTSIDERTKISLSIRQFDWLMQWISARFFMLFWKWQKWTLEGPWMEEEISTINQRYIKRLDSKQLNASRVIPMKITALFLFTSFLFCMCK